MRKRLERQDRIVALLEKEGEVHVDVLVQHLGVSKATVRRDLDALEAEGRVLRTLGGATTLARASLVARVFGERADENRDAKQRIAAHAARLVQPDMVVVLDSGTTVAAIAKALETVTPLTVITNSLAVVDLLGDRLGMRIYCPGGRFRMANLEFMNPSAESVFSAFHADLAFVAVDAFLPGRGGFARDEQTAVTARAIATCADRSYAAFDASKFDGTGHCQVFAVEQIDGIIVDRVPDAFRAAMHDDPYELMVADAGLEH